MDTRNYKGATRKYKRRRRGSDTPAQIAIKVGIVIAGILFLIMVILGVINLVSSITKSFGKKEEPGTKVALENLDGDRLNDKKEDSEENTSEDGLIQIPAVTTEGILVSFYGQRPEGLTTYSMEPYKGNVKEDFIPLNQIYRTPSIIDSASNEFFKDSLFAGDGLVAGMYNNTPGFAGTIFGGSNYTLGTIMLKKTELATINPNRIFISMGANILNAENVDTDARAEKYISAICELKETFSEGQIYVLLAFPVNDKLQNSYVTNENIVAFNNKVVELCNEQGIYYIDIATSLTGKDGKLLDKLSDDGINLKVEYYPYCHKLIEDVIIANQEKQ